MAITGQIVIERPLDDVFDYVADQTNEPAYNPDMVHAEKVTQGPVGTGTAFRSAVRSRGRTVEMLITITTYRRPTSLGSMTTMPQADIAYSQRFEPVPGGTRMCWSARVRPKGAARLASPLITLVGRRQERRTWQQLKRHLESRPAVGDV